MSCHQGIGFGSWTPTRVRNPRPEGPTGRGWSACQRADKLRSQAWAPDARQSKEMAVSLLQHILDGSLVSRERLMQARLFYSPHTAATTPEQAFARWTERVSVQTELASARELAGLSDAELSGLEGEFVRSPLRPRHDRFRGAFRIGAALAAAGAFGLALQAATVGFGDGGVRVLQTLS